MQECNHKNNGDPNYKNKKNIAYEILKYLNENTNSKWSIHKHDFRTFTITRLKHLQTTKNKGLLLRLKNGRIILFYNVHLSYIPNSNDVTRFKSLSEAEIIKNEKNVIGQVGGKYKYSASLNTFLISIFII